MIRLIHHYLITDAEGKVVMEVQAQHVRQVSNNEIEIVTDYCVWLVSGPGFSVKE